VLEKAPCEMSNACQMCREIFKTEYETVETTVLYMTISLIKTRLSKRVV